MKVTPRHNKFINAIADSPIHIIATMRGKDQYETLRDERTNKMTVQKLGVGAKQRDGFEYEFSCSFLLDQKTNTAESQKDNTHIFESEGPVLLTEAHGRKIIQWANSGEGYTPVVRKEEDASPTSEEDDLKSLKSEIVTLCVEKGGQKNEVLMKTLKSFVPSGNPNAIKSLDTAKNCLEAIKALD